MDCAFDRISKIQPGREAWRLKVRVLRMWSVPSFLNPERKNSLEMVLLDEYGCKIHASVRRNLIYAFENRLAEGSVYKMCFFAVIPSDGSYRTTTHEFKLLFLLKTKISLTECALIPTHGFSLVCSDDVCKHRADSDFLVDMIGLLTAVSAEREYVRDGKISKMVIIELTDHRGRVECALFGEYVDALNNFIGLGAGETPIVIIQFAKVKIFKGRPVLQNVKQTSRILFNASVPEVVEFRNSLALHGVDSTQPVGVIDDCTKASKEEEFIKMYPRKTIAELHRAEEDGIFVVCAKVLGLVEGVEWWYPACRCHRAVAPDSGVYYCGGCYKHVIQVIPRFRLSLDVDDGAEAGVFVIFDNDVQMLTKKTCVELVSNIKLGPSGGYPKELEVIIGKELLFKVEKKTDFASCFDVSYRVKKVCDDESLISVFRSERRVHTLEKCVFQTPFPAVVSLEDDEDPAENTQATSFMSSVIISPSSVEGGSCSQELSCGPSSGYGGSCSKEVSRGPVKRKLVDVFEDLEDLDVEMPLKEVKIEKD